MTIVPVVDLGTASGLTKQRRQRKGQV